MIRQAGETGQLYGSVSSRDVAEALVADGFSVARSQVDLTNPIKTVGVHVVELHLHAEVDVTVNVNVARSDDEAARQSKGEDLTVQTFLRSRRTVAAAATSRADKPRGWRTKPDRGDRRVQGGSIPAFCLFPGPSTATASGRADELVIESGLTWARNDQQHPAAIPCSGAGGARRTRQRRSTQRAGCAERSRAMKTRSRMRITR